MNLCKSCGVEVEPGAKHCPLCGKPLLGNGPEVQPMPTSPPLAVVPRDANHQIRRWLLEIISVLAVVGAIVVFAADFAYGMSLTWSRIVLAAIGFLWLSGVFLILFLRWWFLYLLAETTALCLLLWLLDRLTPGTDWFRPLALPVTLLASALLALAIATALKLGRSLLDAIVIAMLAAGLFLPGLELLLDKYRHEQPGVSWSAVTIACVLPFVLILFWLRRWFRRKEPEIRRLFHL
jgi:phosphate/sulfate permease